MGSCKRIFMITKKAGCIMVDPETMRVGIVYRNNHNDFSFPKGHLEQNESIEECAIRETAEETKCDCTIVRDFEPIIERYTTPRGEVCENYNFLAIYTKKSLNTSLDTHDFLWVDFDKVEDKLSYENLKNMWRRAKPQIVKILESMK